MEFIKAHITDGNKRYYIGDTVRILCKRDINSLMYDGGSTYIGIIENMNEQEVSLRFPVLKMNKLINLKAIYKIKIAAINEIDIPFYDDEEEYFWDTHWFTRNGLEERRTSCPS